MLRAEMAASGGYGDPLGRDPAAVAEDVAQEKMTAGHALEEYGVVIDARGRLDPEVTARERARRSRSREHPSGVMGQASGGPDENPSAS